MGQIRYRVRYTGEPKGFRLRSIEGLVVLTFLGREHRNFERRLLVVEFTVGSVTPKQYSFITTIVVSTLSFSLIRCTSTF